MSESLGNKSRKGLLWDILGVFSRQVALLVVTVILARLLAPEEFGIIGMAMVFISITQVFITVGFADGIIQQKDISDLELSSVFYINLTIGCILSGSILLFATPIGNFYEEPLVASVLRYLALIPILGGLGVVHAAILAKRMDFKALTIRDIAATSLGGGVGVVAAFQGLGVYALVWQQITATLSGTFLLWIGSGWFPRRIFSFRKIRKLLAFSSYVFFDQLLRQIFLKIDTLFIGKFFSAATLGFYSRAESLNAQVSNYTSTSLRKIIYPVLSTIQDDTEKFKEVYFKVFNMAVFSGVISAGILYFLAEDIILLLLGSQWQPSVILFQILVFRLLPAPLGPLMGKAMLAKGFSKEKFQVSQLQRFIMLVPLPVGYYYGIEAFTLTLVIAKFVGIIVNMVVMHKLLDIAIGYQLLAFFKPIVPLVLLLCFFFWTPILFTGVVKVIIFLIIQLMYSYITKDEGGRLIYYEFYNLIISTKKRIKF